MDPSERAVCAALALASLGRFQDLARVYAAARALNVSSARLREAALRTHLFAGFPRAIEAFHALIGATGEFRSTGSANASPPTDRRPDEECSHRQRGQQIFERIYKDKADEVRRLLRSFSPVFERAVLEDAYGRILSRPEPDPRLGELMAVCALTAMKLPRQLRSHLEGALRCGATTEELREVIELAGVVAPGPAAAEALSLLSEVAGSG